MAKPKYVPTRDEARINAARRRVLDLMQDGKFHPASEITQVGGSEGLRRFREIRAGRPWEKRYVANGLWEYKLG